MLCILFSMSHSPYVQHAIDQLRRLKYRITNTRIQILTLFDRSESALAAYDIVETLKQSGEKIDVVTTYRILDCLETNGLIHRVLSSGKYFKCAIGDCHQHPHAHDHCHHLMICETCHKIEETHCPDIKIGLPTGNRFLIKGHRLEFFGLCEACQTK